MLEPPGNEIADSDEVARRAVAASARPGGLHEAVDRFDVAVVQMGGAEGVQNAVPVFLDCRGELLHRLEPTAARPIHPARERRGRTLFIEAASVDVAQRLLQAPGPSGLQPHAREPMHVVDLPACPLAPVLHPAPTRTLQYRLGAHLLASNRIERGVGHLDDMKPVEGDLRLRHRSAHARDERRRHVYAHRLDRLGCAAMRTQVLGRPIDCAGIAPFGGEEQPRSLQIVHQRDVVVPAPAGRLVDAERAYLLVALQAPCHRHVRIDQAPERLLPAPEDARARGHRHLTGERQRQRLEHQREAAARTSPRCLQLRSSAAAALDARYLAVNPGFELKKVQVAPCARASVVHGLIGRAALRAHARAGLVGDVQIDAFARIVELHALDRPRPGQTKGLGEYRFLHRLLARLSSNRESCAKGLSRSTRNRREPKDHSPKRNFRQSCYKSVHYARSA